MESFSAEEFVQGFLEEASEHLLAINNHLLRLEQMLGLPPSSESTLERVSLVKELFRSFHTLKGLSAMIGLEPAAQLSHSMETVLQAIQTARLEINEPVLDALLAGTQTLSAAVQTLRDPNQPMPDIAPDTYAMTALLEEPDHEARVGAPVGANIPAFLLTGLDAYPELIKTIGDAEQMRIQAAIQAGLVFSLVIFTPSNDKSSRGENVDLVRSQLQQLGEIIRAAPMLQQGAIRFAFLVAAPQPVEAGQIPFVEVKHLPVIEPIQALTSESREPLLSHTVRVNLSQLDELMQYVGNIVLQQARLGEQLTQLNGSIPGSHRRELNNTFYQIGRTLSDLRRAILRTRLVPLSEAFNHMPLVVRELVKTTGKEVRLVIEGEDTGVDKLLVERLLDPLIHLVRNAIIHGIESPAERAAAGKPSKGRVLLRAVPEGSHIKITISDDGRGVDLETIARKARANGWIAPETTLTPADALDLIVEPGFSTREQADLSAGRGVGLDVVQKTVRSFAGSLSLDSTAGQGTTFTMRLPVTLVIMDALIVRVGQERYALPQEEVDEVVEVAPSEVTSIQSGELIVYRDQTIVARRLARLMGVADYQAPKKLFGLVCHPGEQQVMMLVDQLLGLREVVVQTVTDPLIAQPGISGATELGDGQTILIIDPPGLLRKKPQ